MKVLIIIIMLNMLSVSCLGQNNVDTDTVTIPNYSEIDTVVIYSHDWQSFTHVSIDCSYIYYFQTFGFFFSEMFDDYDDFVNKLETYKVIKEYKPSKMYYLAVFKFTDGSKLKVYFDSKGAYRFNLIWHEIHNDFFYLLFGWFSDLIVDPKVMQKAKDNYNGGVWEINKK